MHSRLLQNRSMPVQYLKFIVFVHLFKRKSNEKYGDDGEDRKDKHLPLHDPKCRTLIVCVRQRENTVDNGYFFNIWKFEPDMPHELREWMGIVIRLIQILDTWSKMVKTVKNKETCILFIWFTRIKTVYFAKDSHIHYFWKHLRKDSMVISIFRQENQW